MLKRYESEMQKLQYKPLSEMSITERNKLGFVNGTLNNLIKELDVGYPGCSYLVTTDGEEYVKIRYNYGSDEGFYICVSADSKLAIAHEVIESLY